MHKSRRPYKLPELIKIDPAKIENGISMKLVNEMIEKHERRLRRYDYLENLYKGFHDVYNEPEKESWKPDNRLAVNFPRYITETFAGYGYGIPIKVMHDDEKINEAIQEFSRDNELSDHEAEMVKKCCIYGHAFEYIYQNEQTKTKISSCNPKECFVIYDDTVAGRALFAIKYGYHYDENGMQQQMFGQILSRELIEDFEGTVKREAVENPYGLIPVVEWRLNDERIGLYEEVAGLIEAYNHAIGEKANDIDAFAEAYLAIMGAKAEDEDVARIRDDRIINIYGTDNAKDILVQFLTKPSADGTQENLLTRLEKLIYETSMVANISDETFGNATSGTALAYKLQAMSNLALSFDRKIEKSIRKRYKVWSRLTTNTSDPDAYIDLSIRMTRNIPKNISEEAQTAAQLSGIVSQETQLGVLSIVPDAQAEMEKIKEEQPVEMIGFAPEVEDHEP